MRRRDFITLLGISARNKGNRTCGLANLSCAGGILFAFIFCPNDQQNGFHAAKTHRGSQAPCFTIGAQSPAAPPQMTWSRRRQP
jgi:hypothetical protein